MFAFVRARWRWMDSVVALGCLVWSLLTFLGRWQGHRPMLHVFGDGGNILSFARAASDPGAFRGDGLFDVEGRADFYFHPLKFWVQVVGGWLDDYGLAILLPTPLVLFVTTMGLYVLGRTLTGRRTAALALLALGSVSFGIKPIATYFGTASFTLPRDWFYAALPWTLALFLHFAADEKKRLRAPLAIALTVIASLTVYAHAPGAAPWIFAWVTGLFFALEGDLRHRIYLQCALYAVALLVMSLFLVNFLGSDHGNVPFETVAPIIKGRLWKGYTDVSGTVGWFFESFGNVGILIGAPLGAALVYILGRKQERRLRLFLFWTVIVASMTLLFPIIDHELAARAKRLPFQYDLIRGARYLYLVGYVLLIWGTSALADHLARRRPRAALALLCVLLTTFVGQHLWRYDAPDEWSKGLDIVLGDAPFGQGPVYPILEAIREMPRGTKILSNKTASEMQTRWYANKPVVHSWKDGGTLLYGDHAALVEWAKREKRYKGAIKSLPKLAVLAREWGADYIWFRGRHRKGDDEGLELVLKGNQQALFRVLR